MRGFFDIDQALVVAWLFPVSAAMVALVLAPKSRVVDVTTKALYAAYVLAVGVITFWPLHFDLSLSRLRRGNWVPFNGTLGMVRSSHPIAQFVGGRDFIANVLLFVPLGLLVPFVMGRKKGLVALGVAQLVVLAFGLEFAQGILVNRTFDIDDPISGAIGVLAGVVIGLIVAVVARSP